MVPSLRLRIDIAASASIAICSSITHVGDKADA